MAQTKPRTRSKTPHGSAQDRRAGNGGVEAAPDWLHGSLGAPKQTLDAMLEMQRQWLQTASQGSENLARDLQELQQAKDPVQLLSAQIALANQQYETVSRQVAAVMQQIYDAQLLWLGQWDEKSQALQTAQPANDSGRAALQAMGQMQDEWLKASRRWIDSLNAGGAQG